MAPPGTPIASLPGNPISLRHHSAGLIIIFEAGSTSLLQVADGCKVTGAICKARLVSSGAQDRGQGGGLATARSYRTGVTRV